MLHSHTQSKIEPDLHVIKKHSLDKSFPQKAAYEVPQKKKSTTKTFFEFLNFFLASHSQRKVLSAGLSAQLPPLVTLLKCLDGVVQVFSKSYDI
jgi:hypothetical protein